MCKVHSPLDGKAMIRASPGSDAVETFGTSDLRFTLSEKFETVSHTLFLHAGHKKCIQKLKRQEGTSCAEERPTGEKGRYEI